MPWLGRLKRFARTLQWQRGLRAGVAVGTAMALCRILGRPGGWAALGAFEAILVDNGGPYRTRLKTMLTVLGGGSLGVLIGSLAPPTLGWAMAITAAFCFVATFARVLAQPIASTSVIILVIYFAGLGGGTHDLNGALVNAAMLCAGGLWAALLGLLLWPVDPFRPARLAVAECYLALGEATAGIAAPHGEVVDTRPPNVWHRALRQKMEEARAALAATPARAPARTVTARSLTVLLETADMLFVRTLRLEEMAAFAPPEDLRSAISDVALLLGSAERAIALELRQRPRDGGESFAAQGSHRMQHIGRWQESLALRPVAIEETVRAHLQREESQALVEVEIGFEAARALWTGMESGRIRGFGEGSGETETSNVDRPGWTDALRADWTFESVMMRHALRMAVVGVVDVALMRVIHISHGFWLAMTSIIVLQPYGNSTLRRSVQRVGGTIAGGILAAVLAVAIRSPYGMVAAISIFAALTLATYAIDYGLYCFFLTPTFVLMSLPHPRDWAYAGVRMGTTLLGALVAVLAMRVLWPERAGIELGRRLSRGALAEAAYLRSVLGFWQVPDAARRAAERTLLAPARRRCGLASNDAEEAVDRMMQEPGFGSLGLAAEDLEKEHALTFTTYLRRLTQSITTLAAVGRASAATTQRIEHLASRLEQLVVSPTIAGTKLRASAAASGDLAEVQMQRMERQVEVLERAASALSA